MSGIPEAVSSLPNVTAPKSAAMRAVAEPFALKGKPAEKSNTALKGMPGKNRTDRKPYAPTGFEWHAQSRGFTCRRIIVENGKRRRKYHGFLSGKAWAELQQSHSGADLRSAVREWIQTKAS